MLGLRSGLDQQPLLAVVFAELEPYDGSQIEMPDFRLTGNIHDRKAAR